MITTEELIRGFSEESFAGWCRGKFADFVPKSERLDEGEFSGARQIGYVRTLADGELNRPLLVVAVQVDGELSERSSRKRQFEFARKALQRAAAAPPGTVKGVMSQGLFVFCGENGDFRMSLVTGRVEGGKPVYNSFKRQTFFVRHDEVNRTFRDQTAQEFGDFKALCEAFSIEALAKQFYKELFAWYEWALSDEMDVRYPNDIHTDKDNRDLIPEHMIRLITRLMFVWFIKQKKLVPDEIFRVEELRKLLKDFDPDSKTEGNYYNAILQNLFFATLNNAIKERAFATNGTTRKENEEHYGVKTLFRNPKGGSWFKVPDDKILKLFEKVPFLNGGLFECLDRPEDEKTKRILYYDGFSREEKVKGKLTRAHVPNGLFFGKERGLIPLFQRYNFTVEENSPNDAVVALDPELLGKVFENLLGAYNPETKETARKQSGSFYTPREIVSYMVDESLKQFLKTRTGVDDAVLAPLFEEEAKADLPAGKRKELAAAIRSVKILDPACGSGAFPMGALHRLVDLLAKLEGQPESLYDLKLHLIENCIYGVDIQTIAVQISKLRFFISLVCEQEPNGRKADNYGILPLPNLETKFVCANTLIGLEKEMGDELHLADEKIACLREELKEVRHRHFSSKSSAEKQKLRQNDKKLRQNIEKRIVLIASTPNLEKIADLEAQIRKLEAEKAKYEGEKWELVIEPAQGDLFGDQASNAPKKKRVDTHQAKREQLEGQIRWKQREIDDEKRKKATDVLLEEAEKLAKWNPYDQNESSPFFDPEWMFGMEEGFDVVIGNPPYISVERFARTKQQEDWKRLYSTYASRGDVYCFFYEKGVNILKDLGVLAIISSNKFQKAGYGLGLREFLRSHCIRLLMDFCELPVFEAATDPMIVVASKGPPSIDHQFPVVIIKSEAEFDTLAQSLSTRGSFYKTEQLKPEGWSLQGGVGLGIIEKMRSFGTPLGKFNGLAIMAGIKTGFNAAFWLDAETACQIARKNPNLAKKFIKPLLVGDDARRWCAKPITKYLVYTPRGTSEKDLGFLREHIAQWRSRLEQRALDQKWYELQQAQYRYAQTYESPKIIYPDIALEPRFSIDTMGRYPDMTAFSIPCAESWLVALLNSRATWFFLSKTASVLGDADNRGRVRCKTQYISNIPVPNIEPVDKARLSTLVERATKQANAGDLKRLRATEVEIDNIVYRIFNLTSDEIAVVEGANTSPIKAEKQEKAPRTVKVKSKTVLVDDEGLD